jgi:hypothetical protein
MVGKSSHRGNAQHHSQIFMFQFRNEKVPETFYLFLIAFISFTAAQAHNEPAGISPRSLETATSGLLVKRISVGQDCEGSEGMWNCMTNSFQRCASGRWSEVMQCSSGTQCSPVGTGYQFNVGFSGSSTVYSSNANLQLENWTERCLGYVLSLVLSLLVMIW